MKKLTYRIQNTGVRIKAINYKQETASYQLKTNTPLISILT